MADVDVAACPWRAVPRPGRGRIRTAAGSRGARRERATPGVASPLRPCAGGVRACFGRALAPPALCRAAAWRVGGLDQPGQRLPGHRRRARRRRGVPTRRGRGRVRPALSAWPRLGPARHWLLQRRAAPSAAGPRHRARCRRRAAGAGPVPCRAGAVRSPRRLPGGLDVDAMDFAQRTAFAWLSALAGRDEAAVASHMRLIAERPDARRPRASWRCCSSA